MSITGELRKWNDETTILPITRRQLLDAIADRIDIEHEKAIRELNNLADAIGDGCVMLPKDADGVPIHIGDELEGYGYPKGGAYCKAIVNDVTILAGPIGSFYKSWLMWDATEVCHHHEPTVEDVLREFVTEFNRDDTELCDEEIIERFAAKLQLRSDQ